jgi:hypothetical protein
MPEGKNKDPLLVTAKVATILVRIGLVIGMIGLGIAGTVAVVAPAAFGDHLTVQITPDSLRNVAGAAVMVFALALASFGLMYDFVTRLAQIIDTVGEGDPFTRDNAARLRRMAWDALIVQLLALPTALIATWLESHVDKGTFELRSDFSITGFGLAIVLFILARVFTKGAEMREDLEGTV